MTHMALFVTGRITIGPGRACTCCLTYSLRKTTVPPSLKNISLVVDGVYVRACASNANFLRSFLIVRSLYSGRHSRQNERRSHDTASVHYVDVV